MLGRRQENLLPAERLLHRRLFLCAPALFYPLARRRHVSGVFRFVRPPSPRWLWCNIFLRMCWARPTYCFGGGPRFAAHLFWVGQQKDSVPSCIYTARPALCCRRPKIFVLGGVKSWLPRGVFCVPQKFFACVAPRSRFSIPRLLLASRNQRGVVPSGWFEKERRNFLFF